MKMFDLVDIHMCIECAVSGMHVRTNINEWVGGVATDKCVWNEKFAPHIRYLKEISQGDGCHDNTS